MDDVFKDRRTDSRWLIGEQEGDEAGEDMVGDEGVVEGEVTDEDEDVGGVGDDDRSLNRLTRRREDHMVGDEGVSVRGNIEMSLKGLLFSLKSSREGGPFRWLDDRVVSREADGDGMRGMSDVECSFSMNRTRQFE